MSFQTLNNFTIFCFSLVFFCLSATGLSKNKGTEMLSADICIYGATSAGVIAAYSAAKVGKSVILIEPGGTIGGLTTGGLGKTDAGKTDAITGLSKKFYQLIADKYKTKDKTQWTFEPHVALGVMENLLKEANVAPILHTGLISVSKNENRISSIEVENLLNHTKTEIKAKEFLDCSYEGDLLGKSGVDYFLGREDNRKYNETLNGFQMAVYRKRSGFHQFPDGVDPYKIAGDPMSGLLYGISTEPVRKTGEGDSQIQAYNLRICLTDSAENMIPITRPKDYDSTKYELLVRLFNAQKGQGMENYFIWSRMPNRKTDVNNRGAFSTDMIGANYNWAIAGYKERALLYQELLAYTKGLLYFYKTDKRVPEDFQRFIGNWGYPKDEYIENNYFTPQVYVREGRRLIGEYVMTEQNCRGEEVVKDGIGLGSYQMDSHNTERIVWNGMVKNEGNVEIPVPHPYPISYRSLTPKIEECENLLVPVCLSASHIAYGSIRMEPVFMILGQSAAMAASMAIDEHAPVQNINVKKLQEWLQEDPYLEKQY